MIQSQFLRRIESKPHPTNRFVSFSKYQLEVPLDFEPWCSLTYTTYVHEFQKEFEHYVTTFLNDPSESDPKIFLLDSQWASFNIEIYKLCLLNRLRHEAGLPLIIFNENEWVTYVALSRSASLIYGWLDLWKKKI